MMTEKRTYEEIKDKVSLSVKQITYMKHAIGIDWDFKWKAKNNKYIPYRNYFYCSHEDREWQYLVFWGLAIEPDEGYYYLTDKGIKMLSEILGIRIEVK